MFCSSSCLYVFWLSMIAIMTLTIKNSVVDAFLSNSVIVSRHNCHQQFAVVKQKTQDYEKSNVQLPECTQSRNGISTNNAISSRKEWISSIVNGAILMTATTMVGQQSCLAADDEVATEDASSSVATTEFKITKCDTGTTTPCVSTASVRQLDLYLPPWTFSGQKADEVMSRLKGAIISDPTCTITKQDGNTHLVVQATRSNDLFGTIDEIEFVLNLDDEVVFFKSYCTNNDNKDFGLNKKRLEEIRKRAGIFGVMGESLQTADSVSTGERGNGPLGQLKAFYGLQSGAGFEDVVLN